MTTKKFEVPEWMPKAVRENVPEAGTDAGAALKFGAMYPANLYGSLWNRIGATKFGVLCVAWSVAGLAYGAGRLFWLVVGACAVAAGRAWYEAHGGSERGERVGLSILAGAICAVVAWFALYVLVIVAIPLVAIVGWFRGKEAQAEAAEQREFREQATSLKPWAVFWAHVANDDDGAEEWAKIRPCIALPGRDLWVDGCPPIDEASAGYPKGWYSDGYPALICTSQVKRKDDPRYVEIRPFPDDYTRSFALVEGRYVVMDQTAPLIDKQIQLEIFHGRRLEGIVVLEKLGPLLNLEDRRRIVGRMRELAGRGGGTTSSGRESTPAVGRPTGAPRTPDQELRDEFDATLAALGNPHDLWMSIMPQRYMSLSDEAKMDHVRLIPDFLYWSMVVRNTDLFGTTTGPVEWRHYQLAIMTGVLLRRSEWYRRAHGLYMCKEYAEAESWLRYALLGTTPLRSPADLQAELQKVAPELDHGALTRLLADPMTRMWVDTLSE